MELADFVLVTLEFLHDAQERIVLPDLPEKRRADRSRRMASIVERQTRIMEELRQLLREADDDHRHH